MHAHPLRHYQHIRPQALPTLRPRERRAFRTPHPCLQERLYPVQLFRCGRDRISRPCHLPDDLEKDQAPSLSHQRNQTILVVIHPQQQWPRLEAGNDWLASNAEKGRSDAIGSSLYADGAQDLDTIVDTLHRPNRFRPRWMCRNSFQHFPRVWRRRKHD